jgi:hypothetical protein
MIARVYLSNIAPGWPFERQTALLASRVPGWPNVPTYVDRLPPAKRKAHSPTSLVRRSELLRSSGVEAIVVASWACLAWEQGDFLDCVAAACARGAILIALDTGRRITPDASPALMAQVAREFMSARRAAKGGPTGYQVSADKRSAEAKAAALTIEGRWRLPTKDYPTDDLLAEAGICRNTANRYLGKRLDAQRKHRDAVAKRRTAAELQARSQENVA